MSSQVLSRPPSAPRRPPIDPRLQARRVEVARDAGRRRLRRLIVVLVVLAVTAGAFALTRSPVLDVDRIAVSGSGRLDAAAVRAASGVSVGDPLVGVDPGATARRLQQVPWIARASVSRQWPSEVRITVVQRVPVGVVGSGSAAKLIDASGRVLGPAPKGTRLAVLQASVPVGPRLGTTGRRLAVVVGGMPPDLAEQVRSAFIGPRGVTVELRDGIRVLFVDAHRLSAKVDALATLLDQVQRADVARIDLTVPSAVALTPRTPGGA